MISTPKSLRIHIGLFGRRNVGKSSLLNALTHQQIAIVSEYAGTTTDPVEKAMELLPIGPVLWIDTAGIDDEGALGALRVSKTYQAIEKCDLALLVFDGMLSTCEEDLIKHFDLKKIPYLLVKNKCEKDSDDDSKYICVSAKDDRNMDLLRQNIIATIPETLLEPPSILNDLLPENALVVLVTPIDKEAPKGRLIMPQVQTLRELLDFNHVSVVCTENGYANALQQLKRDPDLVVCDSQAFRCVEQLTPPQVSLTSFSILFARLKGDFSTFYQGAKRIESLKPTDRVLIAEACTHHPIGEDIGRIKIPALLRKKIGAELRIDVVSGADYPMDLSEYQLVIHCGGCTLNRKAMLNRILRAQQHHVPITNYGMTISACLGILERAIAPLKGVKR